MCIDPRCLVIQKIKHTEEKGGYHNQRETHSLGDPETLQANVLLKLSNLF